MLVVTQWWLVHHGSPGGGGGLGFHAIADCSQVSPGYTVKTSMSGSPGSLHILHFLGTAARQIPA